MEHQWRCKKCDSLIGEYKEEKIFLVYKEAQFIVEGFVIAVCSKCHRLNDSKTHKPDL